MKKSIAILIPFLLLSILLPLLGASLQAMDTTAVSTFQEDDGLREKAISKMDAELLAQLRQNPSGHVTAIVHLGGTADFHATLAQNRADRAQAAYQVLQTFAAQSQSGLRAYLDHAQRQNLVSHYRPYFIFNGVAVTAHPDVLYQIALRNDVQSLHANRTYHLTGDTPSARAPFFAPDPWQFTLEETFGRFNPYSVLAPEWNISQIGADDVWNTYDITGEGVVVANIDTGVQYNHPALVAQYAGNLGNGSFDHDYHWYDVSGDAPVPFDDNGHGTHTMGTIAGGDGPGPFVDDIGVAPGATWIAVKAFGAEGTATTVEIHAAFEWILAPCPVGVQPGDPTCDPARAPDVVSNSWGNTFGASEEYVDDIAALRAAGILPVFSAGNSGPGIGTINAPGSYATTFAVGATDSNDEVAPFSSRGPSPLTEETKPDVVAPGVLVRSSLPGNDYGPNNGTSMAAPHAAGMAALLLEAVPTLDLDTLEEIMRVSAVDLGQPGADWLYGYGRIDALRAVQRLIDSGDLVGTVVGDDTGDPIAGATVRIQGQQQDITVVTSAAGQYAVPFLPSGDYTLTADYYGYETAVLSGVTVVKDQTTTQNISLISLPRHTISGQVFSAISPTVPISNAMIRAVDTPLDPVVTDENGFYTITVAQGEVVLEAAAFGFATDFAAATVTSDTVIDFFLDSLPPILLVDDDEGGLRNYSPHVEQYYLSALDANGYNYTYWNIEESGSPDFDTIRQYAAVVWFGGEFGRIKDISDGDQAQAVIDYLDLGGKFFYIAQSHTFYYGDDLSCATPIHGGDGPCPFTSGYLGVASWVQDQDAEVTYGVRGNPVGNGLGPIPMTYPAGLRDFSDHITGTLSASLAFTATDDTPTPGQVNFVGYTHISATNRFKTVYLATPLEAMPLEDGADVMYAVMEWFGISSLAEGLTLAPAAQTDMALPGETIQFNVRLRNLGQSTDSFALSVVNAPWPVTIWDAGFNTPIDEIGPVAPLETADFGVTVAVPDGVAPGTEVAVRVRAVSQGDLPFSDEAELLSQARMTYFVADSDRCGSGVHFEWVDATGGDRWDLDDQSETNLPEFTAIPLPQPFVFYNHAYDHLWVNDHGTILFGDDNIYDDSFPTAEPPIPSISISDPSGAIYLAWGTLFWHPSDQDEQAAVYSYHDTENGRNRFVIEYHKYENLLGDGPDTFQAILDLNTYDILVQYQAVTYSNFAVAGIEDPSGTQGILYVNDQVPAANILHDNLAILYGVGNPRPMPSQALVPSAAQATGAPGATLDYTLTLSNTGNVTDTYALEAAADFPVTFWDATFSSQINGIGPLVACEADTFGVRVQLPSGTAYARDVATIRARSQNDTLVAATATLTSDNAAPAVTLDAGDGRLGIPGETVTYAVAVQNSGNITDSYTLTRSGNQWATTVTPAQTVAVSPGEQATVHVAVTIPTTSTTGASDAVTLTAASQNYDGTSDSVTLTTAVKQHIAVVWDEPYQEETGPDNWTVSYLAHVHNVGSEDDIYELTAVAPEWQTTIWNDTFTEQITKTAQLEPDERQRIGVRVHIPAGATAPAQDAVLLRATSTLDGEVIAHALLRTAVESITTGEYSARVTPAAAWRQSIAGATLAYTVHLTNTGTVADSYTLLATGNQWATQLTPGSTASLVPGESTAVTVRVQIPSAAVLAVWDQVTLRVQSVESGGAVAQADFITVVGAPATVLYLPHIARFP